MFFAPVVSKKFEIKGSIDSQMAKFNAIRESDPEKSREMFRVGEELVRLSANGEFRKIRQIVDSSEEVIIF
jgi:hypothetical protein